jgi:hypothetical protein
MKLPCEKKCSSAQLEIAAAVKRDPIHLDMALLQAMEEGKL